jgi:hypothetical protein
MISENLKNMKKLISLTAIVCMLISCQKSNESLTETTQTNTGEITKAAKPVNTVIKDTLTYSFQQPLCNGDLVTFTGALFMTIILHTNEAGVFPNGTIVINALNKDVLSGVGMNGDVYKLMEVARTTGTDPFFSKNETIAAGTQKFSITRRIIKQGGADAGLLSFDIIVGEADYTKDPIDFTYKVANIRGACQ